MSHSDSLEFAVVRWERERERARTRMVVHKLLITIKANRLQPGKTTRGFFFFLSAARGPICGSRWRGALDFWWRLVASRDYIKTAVLATTGRSVGRYAVALAWFILYLNINSLQHVYGTVDKFTTLGPSEWVNDWVERICVRTAENNVKQYSA